MIKEMLHKNGNIKIVPFGGMLSVPLWGLDLVFSDYIRGLLLRRLLKRQQPDFVHALELQHGGYIAIRALEDSSIKTQFIATNYGSDIFWFQQFPKHLDRIKKLLTRADRYSAECHRDVELAKKYGFKGEVMPVFPNAGGFTKEQLNKPLTPTAERKVIAIKGYEGWVGRASVAVEALYSMTEELADFKIIFYSCNAKTIRLVKKLKLETGLNIEWHGKGELAHTQMLDLFASARIYVGISLSDGISTSLLEAMAMGAIPVQANSSCASEWLSGNRAQDLITDVSVEQVRKKLNLALGISLSAVLGFRPEVTARLEHTKIRRLAQVFYRVREPNE
jgi:glycosyltransferase involved in cell wall biosynthesis